MMNLRFRAAYTLALAFALSTAGASAAVIFSTLPFGEGGLGIVGPGIPAVTAYQEIAAQFSPTQTATLTSIDVGLSHFQGNNDAVAFSLFTSVGNLPGSLLGTASVPAGTLTTTAAVYNLNFGSILLTAGTQYFLDASTTTTSWQSWSPSTTAVTVPAVQTHTPGGAFNSIGPRSLAFQVNGTLAAVVTPEPGTFGLLFSGLGLAGVIIKRRR